MRSGEQATAPGAGEDILWFELLLALVLAALPLLAGRHLPLIDGPQHLAMARLLTGLWQGDPTVTEFYEVDAWPIPYWLYYLLTAAFSTAVSIETANKGVILLYSIGVALSVRSLLRAFGRPSGWWLVAVPLAWTTSFIYGFMAYLVGVPLVFWGVAAAERSFDEARSSPADRRWLGVLALLTYLAHAQAFLWLMLSVLVLLGVHWRGLRWAARRALPLVPALVLFFVWVGRTFRGAGAATDNSTYGSLGSLGMLWESPVARWTTAPEDLFGGATDASNRWLGLAWLAVVALGIGASWRQEWKSSRPLRLPFPPPVRLAALLAVSVIAWAVLPYSVKGQWYLAPRYLVFVAGTALAAAAGTSALHSGLRRLGIVLAVLFALNTARLVRDFQPALDGLSTLLDRLPAGAKLAHFPFDERNTFDDQGKAVNGVAIVVDLPTSISAFGYIPELEGSPGGWMSPTHHASAYHLVRTGGVVSVSFAASPTNPVRFRPGRQPTTVVEYESEKVDLAAASREFGWFLVRGELQGTAKRLPDFAELEATAGSWQLWRSRSADPAGQ